MSIEILISTEINVLDCLTFQIGADHLKVDFNLASCCIALFTSKIDPEYFLFHFFSFSQKCESVDDNLV